MQNRARRDCKRWRATSEQRCAAVSPFHIRMCGDPAEGTRTPAFVPPAQKELIEIVWRAAKARENSLAADIAGLIVERQREHAGASSAHRNVLGLVAHALRFELFGIAALLERLQHERGFDVSLAALA